jgi:hypothetical protein
VVEMLVVRVETSHRHQMDWSCSRISLIQRHHAGLIYGTYLTPRKFVSEHVITEAQFTHPSLAYGLFSPRDSEAVFALLRIKDNRVLY